MRYAPAPNPWCSASDTWLTCSARPLKGSHVSACCGEADITPAISASPAAGGAYNATWQVVDNVPRSELLDDVEVR